MYCHIFRKIINRYFSSLFFTVTLFCSYPAEAVQLDRIVAVINDEIITLSELEETGKEFFSKIRMESDESNASYEIDQAREKVLNQLITQKLINQQAKLARIRIPEKEFEASYNKFKKKQNLSEEQFQEFLKKSGHSESTYIANFRSQLLRDRLILYEVRSKIVVTEKMMSDHYHKEFASTMEDGGYYLLHMGLSWKKDQSSTTSFMVSKKIETKNRAIALRQKIEDGADFKVVARKYSDLSSKTEGGDLGVFMEDEMAPFMKELILPLEVGELTPVIERNDSFQFFQLLAKQEGGVVQAIPYASVKEDIRKKVFEIKFKEEYNKWVDSIKSKAYIKKMLY